LITIEYLRSFRIGQFAIFDFAISYLGVYLLSPLLVKYLGLTKIRWLYLVLPLSILFHVLVGKYTPLTQLALDPRGGYIFKAILIAMVYLAFRKKVD
jgi:hypothetical protein